MADKIVILRDGRVEQVGKPVELYARPANRFVAGFLGAPQINFRKGVVGREDGMVAIRLADSSLVTLRDREIPLADGSSVTLGIRPEQAAIGAGPVKMKIETTEILGSETIIHARLQSGQQFKLSQRGIAGARTGDLVEVTLPSAFVHIFDQSELTVFCTSRLGAGLHSMMCSPDVMLLVWH